MKVTIIEVALVYVRINQSAVQLMLGNYMKIYCSIDNGRKAKYIQ